MGSNLIQKYSERLRKKGTEWFGQKKTNILGSKSYVSPERWSQSLTKNSIVKNYNHSKTWDDLVTSHYAILLSPHEAGNQKPHSPFKRSRCDLETVHITLTLGHYHKSSNHLFTMKFSSFKYKKPIHCSSSLSNLHLPLTFTSHTHYLLLF